MPSQAALPLNATRLIVKKNCRVQDHDRRMRHAGLSFATAIFKAQWLPSGFSLFKAVLNMDNYRIAALEPVGGKRFVLLKYDLNWQDLITLRDKNYSDDGLNLASFHP